mgnify:CR=1 FL=1
MNLLPIVLAALAGAAVLLIIVGLTATGGSAVFNGSSDFP